MKKEESEQEAWWRLLGRIAVIAAIPMIGILLFSKFLDF